MPVLADKNKDKDAQQKTKTLCWIVQLVKPQVCGAAEGDSLYDIPIFSPPVLMIA